MSRSTERRAASVHRTAVHRTKGLSPRAVIGRFARLRVAVVGDYVADHFIYGETARISREAPVLVLNYRSETILPGGGGNAAQNAAALGARVRAVGAVGADEAGRKLREALSARDVALEDLLTDPARSTPAKMRILAGGHNTSQQQVIRVDRDGPRTLSPRTERALLAALERLKREADLVLLSDYGLGTFTPRVLARANALAAEGRPIVLVDSRHNLLAFRGPTALTPNEEEAEEALGWTLNESNVDEAGWALLERSAAAGVLLTRGCQGMILFERGGRRTAINIFGSDQVTDVTGAGDTVLSTFGLALAAGAPMPLAAELANRAGGLVVMKRGTGTVSAQELAATFDRSVDRRSVDRRSVDR